LENMRLWLMHQSSRAEWEDQHRFNYSIRAAVSLLEAMCVTAILSVLSIDRDTQCPQRRACSCFKGLHPDKTSSCLLLWNFGACQVALKYCHTGTDMFISWQTSRVCLSRVLFRSYLLLLSTSPLAE
jgi:hypothetical protein